MHRFNRLAREDGSASDEAMYRTERNFAVPLSLRLRPSIPVPHIKVFKLSQCLSISACHLAHNCRVSIPVLLSSFPATSALPPSSEQEWSSFRYSAKELATSYDTGRSRTSAKRQ